MINPLFSPKTHRQVPGRVERSRTKGLSLRARLLASCLNSHSPFLLLEVTGIRPFVYIAGITVKKKIM